MMSRETIVARALVRAEVPGCAIPPNWKKFTSGVLSPVYLDNRKLFGNPAERGIVWGNLMADCRRVIDAQSGRLGDYVIAGVEMAGVPPAVFVAEKLALPLVVVRKKTKEHGQGKRIEGGSVKDTQVLIVEDHFTTAGSALNAKEAVENEGGMVAGVFAITSYGFPEIKNNFQAAGVDPHILVPFSDLMLEVERASHFTSEQLDRIWDWISDPYEWTKAHRE